MKLKRTLIGLALLSLCTPTWSHRIKDLKTNYEINPTGIEKAPVFSWRMDAGNTYGARQAGYRLMVAESEKLLQEGIYVYDSGEVNSDLSVCIPYQGSALKPCTRYAWRVQVTDEKKRSTLSETAFFETSLMDLGWSSAEWIGSARTAISPYHADAILDYDIELAGEKQKTALIFGHENEENTIRMELELVKGKETKVTFRHKENGVETTDTTVLIPPTLLRTDGHHHVSLTLRADELKSYNAFLSIDGKRVNAGTGYGNGYVLHFTNPRERCRLYRIGFQLTEGEQGVIRNFVMRDRMRHNVLYADKENRILGKGEAQIFNPGEGASAPMLRKKFSLDKPVRKARLYATARGVYEMYLNGKRVADDFLNPGWTDYRFRLMYHTYDVTPLLKKGNNVAGAMLGSGWWNDYVGPSTDWQNQYGIRQSLLAKLVVEHTDGTTRTIVTDGSWKCYDNGPVTANAIYTGEDYDARKEIKGWCTDKYDDSNWASANIFEPLPSNVALQPYIGQSVTTDTICTAQSVKEIEPNVYIYDMGQNMVGVPSLKLNGKEGETVTLRYAEMCWPDVIPTEPVEPYTKEMYEQNKGRMYLDNYRTALSTDHYTFRGDKEGEYIEPRFTFHGFRYLQVEGLDYCPDISEIRVKVLNSLPQGLNSTYETSDSLINRLYQNILWGERGNFLTIPTDCPQRDERLGWLGDAQIFARTSTYNWQTAPLFHRWLHTVRDNQGGNGNYANYSPSVGGMPGGGSIGDGARGWSEAGIIIPWQLYQQYGDRMILEESYASMKRYMGYVESIAQNHIQPIGGFGDWVALYGTQSDFTNTCYVAWDAQIMAQVASLLGHEEDAKHYAELNRHIREAFNKRYVNEEGYMCSPAGSPEQTDAMSAAFNIGPKTTAPRIMKSQTAYIMPLQTQMLDEETSRKAAAYLVDLLRDNDYCLNTGFIGTPYLNLVLSEYGYDHVAYKLFQQKAYPSWLYPILQGATTIWERWNSYTIQNGFGPVSMNSFNHYSYGAVMDWMMAYSAGIQRDETQPGYKHFFLQPHVGGRFTHIRASYNSVYGLIRSGWKSDNAQLTEDADAAQYGFRYEATVPANTTATLILPADKIKGVSIISGKKGIWKQERNEKEIRYELTSGNYVFQIKAGPRP